MCGRDTLFHTWRDVWQFSQPLSLRTPDENPAPTWNRAPTQAGWTIVTTESGAEVQAMRWGLVPFWAKDSKIGYSTFNARVESVATKPAFREAFKRRRCLVPSSGYYEWKALGGKDKQPYFIHPADAPVMFFAGIWECWQPEEGDPLLSYSILTGPAEETLAGLHDRQPIILPSEVFADWLDGSREQAGEILHAAPLLLLAFHPVSRAVGNTRNNGPQLVESTSDGAGPDDEVTSSSPTSGL
jgi:putative SOS response-associated peptidase YedK